MLRLLAAALLAALLPVAPCAAQFFDEFSGDALAPHWIIQPVPAALEHHVSDGMLHVTNVTFPSHPKSPTNNALIRVNFSPIGGDVLARAIVGWSPGQDRSIEFSVIAGTALLGALRYSELGLDGPQVVFSRGGSTGPGMSTFPAPPAGMHEFVLMRNQGLGGSTMVSAFLNGELLVTYPTAVVAPVGSVVLQFTTAFPNDGIQPMHVDLVQVIPAPGSVGLTLLSALIFARRSRTPTA